MTQRTHGRYPRPTAPRPAAESSATGIAVVTEWYSNEKAAGCLLVAGKIRRDHQVFRLTSSVRFLGGGDGNQRSSFQIENRSVDTVGSDTPFRFQAPNKKHLRAGDVLLFQHPEAGEGCSGSEDWGFAKFLRPKESSDFARAEVVWGAIRTDVKPLQVSHIGDRHGKKSIRIKQGQDEEDVVPAGQTCAVKLHSREKPEVDHSLISIPDSSLAAAWFAWWSRAGAAAQAGYSAWATARAPGSTQEQPPLLEHTGESQSTITDSQVGIVFGGCAATPIAGMFAGASYLSIFDATWINSALGAVGFGLFGVWFWLGWVADWFRRRNAGDPGQDDMASGRPSTSRRLFFVVGIGVVAAWFGVTNGYHDRFTQMLSDLVNQVSTLSDQAGRESIPLIDGRNRYGLEQCNAETREQFEQAAQTGLPIPRFWLAHMLNTGRCSFDADPARARTLAIQALPTLTTLAVTGDADANFLLGSAYEEGLGVTANHIMARNHYRRSCESDSPIACGYLGRMYYNDADSDETTQQMLQYWNKSCDGDWFKSCDSVSGLYATGDRVKKDMQKAIQISQKTCSGGLASGCARLGAVYYQGDGVKRDLNQARKYFNSACEAHDAEGCVLLAWMYHSGEGVAKDSRKAISVVQRACSRGSQKACEMVNKFEADTQSEAKQARRSSTTSQRDQREATLREAALREALSRAYDGAPQASSRAQQSPPSPEGRVSARMQGSPIVLGAMNVDEVNRRLAGQVANLAGCYQQNLLAGSTVQGALSVKLDIKRNGTVKKVTISSSPSSGGTGNRCATRKLKRTPFPHADDGRPTIVTASFQFSSD